MIISIVIAAYNASETIKRTLDSIFSCELDEACNLEVVVVDDGSNDNQLTKNIVMRYDGSRYIRLDDNRGVVAARNIGIIATMGDFVIILVADDELVENWSNVFKQIVATWPKGVALCYAACKDQLGNTTVNDPFYEGYLSFEDLLKEVHSGEYIPLFVGSYIREKLFIEVRKDCSCLILSYMAFAQDGPFWINKNILRIYHVDTSKSISSNWTDAHKAQSKIECYEQIFKRHSQHYEQFAPLALKSKLLRLAVYKKLGGSSGMWTAWYGGASLQLAGQTIVVALLLLLSVSSVEIVVLAAKRVGLIRQYG